VGPFLRGSVERRARTLPLRVESKFSAQSDELLLDGSVDRQLFKRALDLVSGD
jgi:hypothetical protein